MLTRIGDAGQQGRIAAQLQATQARLRAAQTEIATGKRASDFVELGADSGLLLRTHDQRRVTEVWRAQGQKAGDELRAMDGAMANVAAVAERLRGMLVQRLDATTGAAVPLATETANMLEQVEAELNLRLDGRYLFGGSATDRPAVALPTAVPTVPDPTLYYQGDAVRLSVRTDAASEIVYGATAAHPAFAALVAALGQAQVAHLAADRAGLAQALDTAEAAVASMAELRGEMGATAARLEEIGEGQSAAIGYLEEIASGIEDTDLPTAMTRLAQDQAALEAAFLATSRIARLSLADYLR